jgi:hypothetical protein
MPKPMVEVSSTTASQRRYGRLQGVLEHVTSSEIRSRLEADRKVCVASFVTDPGKTCLKQSCERGENYEELLLDVSTCIEKEQFDDLPNRLVRLVETAMCDRHFKAALGDVKGGSRMERLRYFIRDLPQASDTDRCLFFRWTEALAGLVTTSLAVMNARRDQRITKTTQTHAFLASSGLTSSLMPKLVPYKPKVVGDSELAQDPKEAMIKPLSPTDMGEGFIYTFWNKGIFGMFKIGRTNYLKRRMLE